LEARLFQLESENVAKAGLTPEMIDALVSDVGEKIVSVRRSALLT
jgi:hypothetical protein